MKSVDDFIKKWGTESLYLLVGRFIEASPEFPGDGALASIIGEAMGDLQTVLRNVGHKDSVIKWCPYHGTDAETCAREVCPCVRRVGK